MESVIAGDPGPNEDLRDHSAAGRVVASIDIGTNSVKCLVARISEGEIAEVLLDTVTATRLGEGIGRSKRLGEAPMLRTAAAVADLAGAAARLGSRHTRVTGTSAVRDALNAGELASRIHTLCGLPLEALSGSEEARLAYLGAAGGGSARILVLDIGGGSTEWVIGVGDRVEAHRSFPAGAVRFTEAFLHTDPPTAVEVAQTRNAARIVFADAPGAGGLPMRVVGGTARALALVAMGRGRDAEGFRITSSELARQTRLYAAQSVSQRRDTPGLDPDRADIILAGAIILETCMSRAGMTEAECTLRGLRHGVVLDMARGL